MSENICYRQCPKRAMMGIEVRTTSPNVFDPAGQVDFMTFLGALLGGAGGMGNILQQGAEGDQQKRYAADECPSRNMTAEEWTPSGPCMVDALMRAQKLRPFEGELTRWEVETLGRVGIGPDLNVIRPDSEEQPPTA